jgi:malate synthase
VRNDKEREVKNGHDGTGLHILRLVSVAKRFLISLCLPNQIDKKFDYHITENDLLEIPKVKLPKKESEKISTSEFFTSNPG